MRSLEKVAVKGRLVNIKIGRNGRIAGIDELGPAKPDSPVAIPGMIDLHVHSRQPGGNHKEDWDHLWKAAVKGGVTTIVTMPNTSPPIVDLETLQLARELASSSLIKPLFWFGATAKDNSSAIKLACQEKDVVGIKMFMGSSTEAMTIEKPEDQLRVLRLGAKLRVPVAIKLARETLPEKRPLPCTESSEAGVVVPMPTLPVAVMRIYSLRAIEAWPPRVLNVSAWSVP